MICFHALNFGIYPCQQIPAIGYKYEINYLYDVSISDLDKRLLQQFFAAQPVKKAYLFGSYARKEANKKSDIDILVELDYSKHIGFGFVQMQFDLEKLLNKKVDLVATEGLSRHIGPFIDKDKLLIYAK